jgi:hypothetical protein
MKRVTLCSCWLLIALCALATRAQAQAAEEDPHLVPVIPNFESPERFILELRGGPYQPSLEKNTSYGVFFKGDSGPNLGFQLDGILYHEERWFYLTAGTGLGLANYDGNAYAQGTSTTVSEKTTLVIVPVLATVGVRFEALARQLHVPIILGARAGWEWAHWDTNTGTRDDASGWSLGPFVSAQIALDLDSIEPGGARNLDEEWGINHTYLFGEIFHFEPTKKSLPIGATSWLIGLGFVF